MWASSKIFVRDLEAVEAHSGKQVGGKVRSKSRDQQGLVASGTPSPIRYEAKQ